MTFGAYREDGVTVRAPQQTATAPAGVAADVLDVSGLDTASHLAKPYDTLPPPARTTGSRRAVLGVLRAEDRVHTSPRRTGITQPYTNCGYTPRQIRGAYGVTESGMTGKGQTVAVVDAYASPTMLSDANQYAKVTGDKPFAPGQYTQDLASDVGRHRAGRVRRAPAGTARRRWTSKRCTAMAPNANVVYVGAASCTTPTCWRRWR